MADRPETQDLLRRHAEVLARELGQAGYDSVSLDFAGGEARAGRDDAPEPRLGAGGAGAVPPPRPRPRRPPRRGRSAAGGLDVRL